MPKKIKEDKKDKVVKGHKYDKDIFNEKVKVIDNKKKIKEDHKSGGKKETLEGRVHVIEEYLGFTEEA